jgi:hypothetical protein
LIDENGDRFALDNLTAAGTGPARYFWGQEISPPPGTHWRYSQENIDKLSAAGLIVMTSNGQPRFKRYLKNLKLDYQGFFPLTNLDKPSWMKLSFSR